MEDEYSSIGEKTNVSQITNEFKDIDAFIESSIGLPLSLADFRGDYLAIDGTTHSAMALEYDQDKKVYWTLEGNISGHSYDSFGSKISLKGGDEVGVLSSRVYEEGEITGWGSLSIYSGFSIKSGGGSPFLLKDRYKLLDTGIRW